MRKKSKWTLYDGGWFTTDERELESRIGTYRCIVSRITGESMWKWELLYGRQRAVVECGESKSHKNARKAVNNAYRKEEGKYDA